MLLCNQNELRTNISASLGSLSNSSVGTKKIKPKSSPSNKKTEDVKEVNGKNDIVTPDESHATQQKMAEHASKGDHGSDYERRIQRSSWRRRWRSNW